MRKMGGNGFLFFLCQIERKVRKYVLFVISYSEGVRWMGKKENFISKTRK